MAALLTKSERRKIYFSVILYGVSMLLPAYRIQFLDDDDDRHFDPGYEMAWFVEGAFWQMTWEASQIPFRRDSASTYYPLGLILVLIPGAMANHFFLLGCLALRFRWLRMAVIFSILSALCAIGCLLPWEISDPTDEWSLGPGYFVWCTAAVVLTVGSWRVARRELKSQPLFDGILTSRKTNSLANHPDS